MSKKFRLTFLPVIAGLALVAAIASPSHAVGAPFQIWGATQTSSGMPSNVPATTHCTNNVSPDVYASYGCYKEYGDRIFVKDVSADGHSAMVYYTVDGDDAACVNTGGNGTVAVCDLADWIPENKTVCIWSGWIEMGSGPSRFTYYIAPHSKECFVNND